MNAYTVQPNDTVESITRKFTGNASRAGELVSANPKKPRSRSVKPDFIMLRVGERLYLPMSWTGRVGQHVVHGSSQVFQTARPNLTARPSGLTPHHDPVATPHHNNPTLTPFSHPGGGMLTSPMAGSSAVFGTLGAMGRQAPVCQWMMYPRASAPSVVQAIITAGAAAGVWLAGSIDPSTGNVVGSVSQVTNNWNPWLTVMVGGTKWRGQVNGNGNLWAWVCVAPDTNPIGPNGWGTRPPSPPYGGNPSGPGRTLSNLRGVMRDHLTGVGLPAGVTTLLQSAQSSLAQAQTYMSTAAADTTDAQAILDYTASIAASVTATQSAQGVTSSLAASYSNASISTANSAVANDAGAITSAQANINTTTVRANAQSYAQSAINAASDAISQAGTATSTAAALDAAAPGANPSTTATTNPSLSQVSLVQCSDGSMVAAGTPCPSSSTTNYWPWIIGGVGVAAGIGFVLYAESKKTALATAHEEIVLSNPRRRSRRRSRR